MSNEIPQQITLQSPPPTLSPVRRPARYRSHEQEDLDKMADVIFFESTDPCQWVARPLHEALLFQQQLGTELAEEFFLPPTEEDVMSISGRMRTYPTNWTEAKSKEMALSGLYLNDEEKPTCFCCGVEFRAMNNPGHGLDPWLEHKKLASNCLQLKRYQQDGPHATNPGKAMRRNSAGDVSDLLPKPSA